MSADALTGLNCPRCGGIVPVPEGSAIVRCPYCDLRSMVRGERGVPRYQASVRLNHEQASASLKRFLSGNLAIAMDAARSAQLSETFLAYLPFWAVWGRVAGWAFGQKKIRRDKSTHWEPREVKVVEEMSWNSAACDVGEFGVNEISLPSEGLAPFDAEALHSAGLVFEPVGSFTEAQKSAEKDFALRVQKASHLDRISQLFVRWLNRRFGLVYYPLWVLRYLYRGRSFQIVVDGCSGKVLYGKAPGNTLYRAGALVLGMAMGAFVAIDASAAAIYFSDKGDDIIALALVALVVGALIMYTAYRTFRYGEQYEYRRGKSLLNSVGTLNESVQEMAKWLDQSN